MKLKIPDGLKRFSHAIEEIEERRGQDPDLHGFWVHLKRGWKNSEGRICYAHSFHGKDISQVASKMAAFLERCNGGCCSQGAKH